MNKIAALLLISTLALALSCGGQSGQNLSVSTLPSLAIIIDSGDPLIAGNSVLTPPYFTINAISISWPGPNKAHLVSIQYYMTATASGSGATLSCGGSVGGSNSISFPTDDLNPGDTVTSSSDQLIGCGGIPVPTPIPQGPHSYSLNVTLYVTAAVLDSGSPANTIGRTQGITHISLK